MDKETHYDLPKLLLQKTNSQIVYVNKFGKTQVINENIIGLSSIYDGSFLKTLDKNLIQIHDIGSLPYIESYILTDKEVEEFNKNELYIFLTDQVLYFPGTPFKLLVKYEDINDFSELRSMNYQESNNFFSPELESIRIFIENNNLTNVTVCVNNTDPFDLLKKYNFKIKRIDPFLQWAATVVDVHKSDSQFINSENIKTKLWCGNLRYEPHRHIVAAYLTNFDSIISWGFKGSLDGIKNFLWFDIDEWKQIYPTHYNKLIKGLDTLHSKTWSLDFLMEEIVLDNQLTDVMARPWQGEGNDDFPSAPSQSSPDLYKDSFVSVINESYFARPFPVYSEKVLNAIANFRPFIVVGPAYSLKMLKDDGFKTFDEFWDESYDDKINHESRFIKLFDLFEEINNWPIKKCREIHRKMLPILEHNRNLINSKLHTFNHEK
jgi:hypothetical protein